MEPQEHQRARFGAFEADLLEGTLTKSGRPVALQDQPFRVLVLLLRRPGVLLPREEVQDAIWPDGTNVDFEHGLNTALNKLRAALGDSAASPRFVETVPRKGYRFLAPVEWIPEGAGAQPDALRERFRTARHWRAAGLASVALLAIIVALLQEMNGPAESGGGASKVMLAVMPFTDLSRTSGDDYFSEGLTEEMISRLGGLAPSRLGVIARSTVMAYKDRTLPIGQIGSELGVAYVLEGSVRREDDRVRVTAQLIRVDDGTHLWTEAHESTIGDILGTQRRVAGRIADSLAVDALHISEEATSVDPAVYEAYLKGLHYRDMLTEDGYRKAIEQFERAVSLDPEFAPAYASMSACYCLLAGHGLEVDEPATLMERTQELATRALALDDGLAEAHGTLGMAHLKYAWDWPAAEEELRRATELNPSDPMAAIWYSFYLSSQGFHRESIEHAERARKSDPIARIPNANLGWQYYEAREYDEAIRVFEETLALFPDFWIAHWGKGLALLRKGLKKEAMDQLQSAVGLSQGSSAALAALSLGHAVSGQASRSREILEQLLSRARTGYVSPAIFVPIYAELGDLDRAFGWLQRAYDVRSRSLVWIRTSHDFDALRDDPRYDHIVGRMGLEPSSPRAP